MHNEGAQYVSSSVHGYLENDLVLYKLVLDFFYCEVPCGVVATDRSTTGIFALTQYLVI